MFTELVEQGRNRLIAVGDISCDRGGSIEFLMKTTSIDCPVFIYDPLTEECHDSYVPVTVYIIIILLLLWLLLLSCVVVIVVECM